LRKANRAAGLDWTCLDYRHTFGSLLAQKGVSLYKISTLMGNSPEICRRHYAALIPEAMTVEVDFSTAVSPHDSSHLAG
jgi:integrase